MFKWLKIFNKYDLYTKSDNININDAIAQLFNEDNEDNEDNKDNEYNEDNEDNEYNENNEDNEDN